MSDLENICLACGICCTGTLIGFVQLESEEFPALRNILEIEESDDIGFFLQPCKKFCDGCTIYSQRPRQCASFECALLKSVDQKELAFKTAVEIVEEVKQKRLTIEAKLATTQIALKSDSFYFKIVELRKLLSNNALESPLENSHLELMSELDELNVMVSKSFGVSYFK